MEHVSINGLFRNSFFIVLHASRIWIFLLRLLDLSRNRLALTAYSAIISAVFLHAWVWIFFFRIVGPSRNRKASTAYFAIISTVFCMHGSDFIFSMIFSGNSKNINRKNQKIYFSFDSAHSALIMKVGSKLRGGSAYILCCNHLFSVLHAPHRKNQGLIFF